MKTTYVACSFLPENPELNTGILRMGLLINTVPVGNFADQVKSPAAT